MKEEMDRKIWEGGGYDMQLRSPGEIIVRLSRDKHPNQ